MKCWFQNHNLKFIFMQHVHAWRSTIFRPYHAFHEIYMGLQPLNHEWFLQACFFLFGMLGIPERFGERRTKQRKRTLRANGPCGLKGSLKSCLRRCSHQQKILQNLGAYLTLIWNWNWNWNGIAFIFMQILWLNFWKRKKIETIFNPAFFQEPKTHPS